MLNLSIISLTSSFQFASNSPLFVNNHHLLYNCNFQRFKSCLFYNQKSLKIDQCTFNKGLGSIIINEFDQQNEQKTFYNQNFSSTLPIDDNLKSISIINCKFSNITNENVIIINQKDISLYITSTSFISCISNEAVIHLTETRCFTMTHVCTYMSGTNNQDASGSILWYDMKDDDFLLCLYNTFVETKMKSNDKTSVIDIQDGDQYFRCNNITGSSCKGFHFNTPNCFSFGLSTVVECENNCFMMAGFNGQSENVKDKLIEMSNFINNGSHLIKPNGHYSYTLIMDRCVLLSTNENSVFADKEDKIEIKVMNSIILTRYGNSTKITFTNCTRVEYDKSHITLHAHYTNGAECAGPADVEKNEDSCEVGDCIDKRCNKTIEFPTDVYQYTTFCHHCTSEFTESAKFTQSNVFSESAKFSKSNMFSNSDEFTTLGHIQNIPTSESDFVFEPGNQGSKEKGTNKAMIGAIAGVLAAAVIAAVVATVLIIKKRNRLNVSTEANMAESNISSVTTANDLNSVMEKDDPFADDFNGEEL